MIKIMPTRKKLDTVPKLLQHVAMEVICSSSNYSCYSLETINQEYLATVHQRIPNAIPDVLKEPVVKLIVWNYASQHEFPADMSDNELSLYLLFISHAMEANHPNLCCKFNTYPLSEREQARQQLVKEHAVSIEKAMMYGSVTSDSTFIAGGN